MSAAGMNWPAVTATLLFLSEPTSGSGVISTANSGLGGVSLASLNPKSATVSEYTTSSGDVIVRSLPLGATLMAIDDHTSPPCTPSSATNTNPPASGII